MRISSGIQLAIGVFLIAGSAASDEVEGQRPGGGLLRAAPVCVLDRSGITVQTIVDVSFRDPTRKDAAPEKTRQFWRLDCEFATSECVGTQIRLANVDRSGVIQFLDVAVLSGARIVSRTDKVVIVQWGPYRTMTLDRASQRFEYRESAGNSEGRGWGPCPTPPK